MVNKIKQISKYSFYVLFTNTIYGIILYYTYTWLVKHSFLYAYFGNLVLIILGLAIDEYLYKMYQSKKLVMQIKKEKDIEKNYRLILWLIDNTISFKTILYLFYIFILIGSQIIVFNPTLVSENIGNFILANNYSILFLIAIDTLIGQFSKDREKMKKISAKFKENMTKNQD